MLINGKYFLRQRIWNEKKKFIKIWVVTNNEHESFKINVINLLNDIQFLYNYITELIISNGFYIYH